MKHRLAALIVFVAGGIALVAQDAGPSAENARAVMSVKRRLSALDSAGRVLSKREAGWKAAVAGLPDPFFRVEEKPVQVAVQEPARAERSDSEVLRRVATDINPTGTVLIGSEHYLLLSGRRFKVGDQISVTLEGTVYRVALASIERNSYTLRLNDTELRREFK